MERIERGTRWQNRTVDDLSGQLVNLGIQYEQWDSCQISYPLRRKDRIAFAGFLMDVL